MTNASPSVRPFEAAARIVKQLSPNTVAVSTDVIPAGFLSPVEGQAETWRTAAVGPGLAVEMLFEGWHWAIHEGGWCRGEKMAPSSYGEGSKVTPSRTQRA